MNEYKDLTIEQMAFALYKKLQLTPDSTIKEFKTKMRRRVKDRGIDWTDTALPIYIKQIWDDPSKTLDGIIADYLVIHQANLEAVTKDNNKVNVKNVGYTFALLHGLEYLRIYIYYWFMLVTNFGINIHD